MVKLKPSIQQRRRDLLVHVLNPSGLAVSDGAVWAPIPPNLPVPLVGDCFVSTGTLSRDGYAGTRHVEILQERDALLAGIECMHLCNRPFCLQPSHLAPGTRAQNQAYRKARLNNHTLDEGLSWLPWAKEAAPYERCYDETAPVQLSFPVPNEDCRGHSWRSICGAQLRNCDICGLVNDPPAGQRYHRIDTHLMFNGNMYLWQVAVVPTTPGTRHFACLAPMAAGDTLEKGAMVIYHVDASGSHQIQPDDALPTRERVGW